MATRMLIDARHPEETRVAVLQGNRIEEFDFESAEHKQIKGNIYLAKVTRVEPSLQAAFVDFGGNRHGFLAFSEIHPDYYQIPREDRERLLAEEAEAAEEEAKLRAEEEEDGHAPGDEYDAEDETGESFVEEIAEDGVEEIDTSDKDHVSTIEGGHVENGEDDLDNDSDEDGNDEAGEDDRRRGRGRGRRQGKGGGGNRSRAKQVDEVRAKRMALRRRYKIQDVIQRRQVLLVQVVKEERGNKGAALTTYLSLAGRYCVLMPNSSHGGGISRKISSAADRKRLKTIVSDLSLPKSMGLIVRTAGLQRTKPEIKRDFDYLARLWDEIRENTLKSVAPALIHSDSSLIKRAIRDIYNKEIEEVVVEGEAGYKSAKEFMKLLMPSHARRVKAYSDPVPLFQRYGAEDQLRAMYDPVVQLKSGGYLVINPTEALVSIDINSGRSTKEHGIEQTALATNLEAAREIARQLRLRDMAGLVVIDFIDMEYSNNIRKVERAMKDALKNDRARIQVGRISGFGLMEMSRQRLRTGVLEATTRECPHCDGTGLVRTASSAGLSALRLIEDEAAKGKGSQISLYASTEAAIYLLNTKRGDLAEIEDRYGVSVEVLPEGEDEGAKMRVASSGPRPTMTPKFAPIVEEIEDDPIEEDEDFEEEDDAEERAPRERRDGDEDRGGRKRRRRRGGRNRRDEGETDAPVRSEEASTDDDDGEEEERERDAGRDDQSEEDRPKKRRRRGGRRRRGRGRADGENGGEAGEEGDSASVEAIAETLDESISVVAGPEDVPQTVEAAAAAPKKRTRRKKVEAEPVQDAEAVAETAAPEPVADEAPAKPKRTRKKKAETEPAPAETAEPATEADAPVADAVPAKPKRTRAKKAAVDAPANADAEAPAAATSVEPAAANDANGDSAGDTRSGKRGWWQRTFGE
ncbi:Rne/Rng family ribonuclease [Tsuneonella troitsensis]|uniref:Rne/Rng family ribonuclease n=1 Tax=Tsuneonella troitsensis TaxID=292222 RepID=UPI00070A87EB|nr:ribonuclease E/G [Tsuneonella troitsensis]